MTREVRGVTLRAIEPEDEPFVFGVFRAVREPRFIATGLPTEQIAALLEQQYRAQREHYRQQFPDADFDLVLCDDQPVGYLYARRAGERFALIDIALLPGHQGLGIGTELVGRLIEESTRAGKPLRAHVEKENRAWDLWRRLGFEVVADDGVHYAIERPPSSNKAQGPEG